MQTSFATRGVARCALFGACALFVGAAGCGGGAAPGPSGGALERLGQRKAAAAARRLECTQVCDGLVPGPLPDMVSHSRMRNDSIRDVCLPGVGDGNGTLALSFENGLQPHDTHIRFTDSNTGDLIAEGSGIRLGLYDQLDGFLGFESAGAIYQHWFSSFDSSGAEVSGPTLSYGSSLFQATDPNGGLSFAGNLASSPFGAPTPQVGQMNADGSVRWMNALAGAADVAGVGADEASLTLVLRVTGGTLTGQWFDTDGTALTGAFALLAGVPANTTFDAFATVDGQLFIRRFSPAGGTSWVKACDSGSDSCSDAPSWLAANPNTSLTRIRGDLGYALAPNAGATAFPCSQTIEIRAPDGTFCGSSVFDIAPDTCTTNAITVGRDGTVIQQLPSALEPEPHPHQGFCTWRFWPAAFL